MGASNFARGNTSKVFAVLMNTEEKYSKCSECDEKYFEWEEGYVEEDVKDCIEHDTEYRSCEDFEVDDFKHYIKEVAENHAMRADFKYSEQSGSDNDRNYCATDLFSLRTSKYYGDIEVNLTITGQIVSAYYEGASLDYRLEVYNGGEDSEVDKNFSVADIVESLFEIGYDHYTSDMGKGLRKILLPKAVKWAEKEAEKMIETIENIFTEVSMPLVVTAQFSNGETFYTKA